MEMNPVYNRSMDLHPQMNQIPKTPYWIPGFGNGSPQMKLDGPTPQVPYEYWSHGANHGYPVPCHGCCNHGNFPCYDRFIPSYSRHVPHFIGCGNYPTFYPVLHTPPYHVPPPHYSVDHSRYEYDGIPRNHPCCGCLNHPSHQYRDKKVMLEEQEPEDEKESKYVPVQPKSYPFPVIWIPHESSIKNEHQKPNESKAKSSDNAFSGTKAPESELKGWNGWFPLDLDSLKSFMENHDKKEVNNEVAENAKTSENDPKIWKSWSPLAIDNLRSSMQNEDGKRAQNENTAKSLMQSQGMERNKNTGNEDKNSIPFPVVWMPFCGKQQENGRGGETAAAKTHDGRINDLKFSVPKLPDHNDAVVKVKDEKIDQRSSSDIKERTIHQGSIPVWQINHEKKKAEGTGEKQTNDAEDLSQDKETSKKYQSSPPLKTSKLPPVCSRVDPLPKKRNGDGKSRSPSPPSREEQQNRNEKELKNSLVVPEVRPEGGVKKVRVIPVAGEPELEDGTVKRRNVPPQAVPNVVRNTEKKTELGEMSSKESPATKETNEEATKSEVMKRNRTDKDKREPVKRYSIEEAATAIQSAYRGYEVRKWEPLKKLKQMAKVFEEMVAVRNQIQEIEASSKKDEKQIVMVGETIMSLLLKLDAVQGLHPSLRGVRKSLARELMKMQEQLDFIKSSEAAVKEASVGIASEYPGKETAGDGTRVEESMIENSFGSGDKIMNSKQIPNGVELDLKSLPDFAQLSRGQQSETIEQSAEQKEENLQVAEEPGASVYSEVPAFVVSSECGDDAGNFIPNVPQTLMSKVNEEDKVQNEIGKLVSVVEEGINHGKEVGEEYHYSKGADESKLVMNNNNQSEPPKKLPQDPAVEEQQLVSIANDAERTGCLKNENIVEAEIESTRAADIAGASVTGISSLPEIPETSAELSKLPVKMFEEDMEGKLAFSEIQGRELPHDSETSPGNQTEERVYGARTEPQTSETWDTHQSSPICHEHGHGKLEAETDILGETEESGGQMVSQFESEVSNTTVEGSQITEAEKKREELGSETPESRHVKQSTRKDDDVAKTFEIPLGYEVQNDQPLERDKKLVEENQRLKEMMEKLMETGKEQLDVISRPNGRVKDLEKKLSRKKNVRMRHRQNRNARAAGNMKHGDSTDMR